MKNKNVEVPSIGEYQSFLYDDETDSGFIIRNEGGGRFKAEEWRNGDITDNVYGTYAEMKAWTADEAIGHDRWRVESGYAPHSAAPIEMQESRPFNDTQWASPREKQQWMLVDEKTGDPVRPGDTVQTFRGEVATLKGFTPPARSGSSGRVSIRLSDATADAEYYPTVIGCVIKGGPFSVTTANDFKLAILEQFTPPTGTEGKLQDTDHVRNVDELRSRPELVHQIPGTCLGHGLPDWPKDLTTFEERRAYQRGVAHARYVDQSVALADAAERKLPETVIRPATLYVETFTSHEYPNARWAQIDLTPAFVVRVQELRELCNAHGVADVRVFGSPGTWSGEDQWHPDVPHLRVSKDDFWYEAVPKNVDAEVRTQAVPIDTMIELLRQTQFGLHDSEPFKWIDGALYCDGTDAELLADIVAEDRDEVKSAPPSPSM